jgi:FkbM family methyltransferase
MNDLLIRGLRRMHLLRSTLVYARRSVCGEPFKIPLFLDMGLQHLEERDAWLDPVLQVLLTSHKGTFVDVGVNIGRVLLKVRVIAPMTPYLGFEPNPACLAYVAELLRVNHLKDITVVPAGLGLGNGIRDLELHHTVRDDPTATMVPGFKQGHPVEQRLLAACLRFDTMAPQLLTAPLGVVKVDVEGGEADVLEGMVEHLRRDRPALLLKMPPLYRPTNDERARRQERIETCSPSWATASSASTRSATTSGWRRSRGPSAMHGELEWSNYIALHGSTADEVLKGFSLLTPQR